MGRMIVIVVAASTLPLYLVGKRYGKNDRHCGNCQHLATVSCLYLNPPQFREESSRGRGTVIVREGEILQ